MTASSRILFRCSNFVTLQDRLTEEDFQKVTKIIEVGADKEYVEISNAQKRNFEVLKRVENQSSGTIKKKVVNLSKTTLTDAQIGVLNKGLKFAVAPTEIPKKQMIVAIESSLTNVGKTTADTILKGNVPPSTWGF